jgi:hypothetical protein
VKKKGLGSGPRIMGANVTGRKVFDTIKKKFLERRFHGFKHEGESSPLQQGPPGWHMPAP